MPARPIIAVTCGEPAGIGPEIAIRAAWQLRAEVNCVLIGDAAFLAMTAAAIDADIGLVAVSIEAVRNDGLPTFGSDRLVVVDCPLHAHVVAGTLDVHNAPYVLECLDIAIESALQRWSEAIVTGPLQKSIINDAGVAFTGHTEYLAAKTGTPLVVMMLALVMVLLITPERAYTPLAKVYDLSGRVLSAVLFNIVLLGSQFLFFLRRREVIEWEKP